MNIVRQNDDSFYKLPKGWVWTKIIDVCELINGRAFKPSEWALEGLPIIRIQNLNDDKADFNYCNFKVDEKYLLDNGQLLFAWSGTPGTSFGAHIWKKGRAVLNQHIFKVQINEENVDKIFLMHLLNRNVDEYIRKAHGTAGLAHITRGKFENSIIPLPPLPEQKRIMAKIEELFTRLDAGVEALTKIKGQIKRYRQAVLKYAFEGKLTQEWREKTADSLERVADRKVNYNVRTIHYLPKRNDLSELPEGWAWKYMKDVGEINPKFNGENLPNDLDVSFIPMKCVEELTGYIDLSNTRKLSDVRKGYTPFKDGDLLFAKITPCMENGKVAIASGLKNDIGFGSTEFHVIRANPLISGKFIFFFLIQEGLRKDAQSHMTGSAGQLRVPADYMKDIPIPLPPPPEQHQIVSEIERRFSVADEVEKTVDASLKQAERLRQSILKQAFEGKLVPQDPLDEPANKLLERIMAEKAKIESEEKAKRQHKRIKT